ncbi:MULTISPECIES: hypothetical protein [unclassified Burkholderia]|uniref:hypothetical protein n=1 Tax=unclassified Burkholderia TaxID=2613784 RepID=UPI00214F9E2A|nr:MULTISPECIES: hypothetical protein [unclassified Burkholderia]MCR4469762.1 hypothetical protein [Burkholderia sp. SCN-KJ]
MNPMIPPLPPLEATSAVTREEAVSRPAAGGAAGANTLSEPGSALVDLFRSKLDAARLAPPSASRSHGPSALTEVVTEEDHAVASLRGDVDRFAGEAPLMTPQEAVAQSIKVQMQVSEMVGKLYVGEAVAQGTKGSVQTLMKNQ